LTGGRIRQTCGMRQTPGYILRDPDEVKRLIRENPWGTIVSHTSNGLVASHYPVVLEEDAEGISIVSHFGRPDEKLHELGQHDVMVIVQGPHGYVSPGWYENGEVVPTWNHVTAHLYGRPEILSESENFQVLGNLVDHFERVRSEPISLALDQEGARLIAKRTVGIRLVVARFEARLKLSQNKSPEVVARIVGELEGEGPYASPGLAAEMRRVHQDVARTE
jgi:transcriptional regulator